MDAPLRVLVIEDNPDLAANLIDYLLTQRHLVDAAGDGLTGLRLAEREDFDVLLLDLMLPGIGGMDVCRQLRQRGKTTPILMLTACASLDEKIAGLEAGADDYLVKPFAMREVAARIRALARRLRAGSPGPVLRVGQLSMDTARLSVRRGEQELTLPKIPMRLLESLMRASPRVVPRAELELAVWGDAPPDSDALRSHLHILRTVIDRPFGEAMLHTVRGMGWQLLATGSPPDGDPA